MSLKLIREGIYPQTSLEELALKYSEENDLELTLEWISGQWCLHSDQPQERPIRLDLDRELTRHQDYFKRSSVHKEVLARSLGIKGAYRPKVVDLTAGLLGDSLLFLSFGCEVISLERNPVVGLLIESAIKNATHPALSRLEFRSMDAMNYLAQNQVSEVLFYDPMFEDPNQKSSPRKEMRIFRGFVGKDQDALSVFEAAKASNPKRLVIKRPRHSVELGAKPDVVYEGKATRYDVYLARNMATMGEIS